MEDSAIGIDVGATNIKGGVVNLQGVIVRRVRRETRAAEGLEAVVEVISEAAQDLQSSQPVSCIGIGVPGLVDANRGVVRRPPNLPGWDEVRLKELLQDRLRVPLLVANDVDMVAYGEWKSGAGRGVRDLLVVTVGTGVGGGIIAKGQLHPGAHGFAGEIGHTTVDPDGPPCNCGSHGCLETFVGAEYITKRTISLMEEGVQTSIRDLVKGDVKLVTPEVIARAAEKGDGLAQRIMSNIGEHLGIALSNAIALLDPERVVVGGGISKAGEILFEAVRGTVRERVYSYPETQVEIVPAELGDDGGVIGAATYAIAKFHRDLL